AVLSSPTTVSRGAVRSTGSAVAAWWTVAPRSVSSATPGFGGTVAGPESTRWTSSPARAPAAAGRRGGAEVALGPGPRACGGGQARVVRPAPARRDEAIGLLGQGGPDEIFEAP